jgi:hypothetical protein
MELTDPPLPPEISAATPPAAQVLIVALQVRTWELEAQLRQNSSNSSEEPPPSNWYNCRAAGAPRGRGA